MPRIFDSKYPEGYIDVDHINGYLLPGPDIYVKSRRTPLFGAPQMIYGSKPTDGGNLILSEEEKNYFIKKYPQDKKFVRRFMGAEDFIHNKKRYCLWLVDATLDDIRKNKFIYERVKAVKEFRLKSKKISTQESAETPHLFQEIRQTDTEYILVPRVSSELRKYIPIDYVSPEIICSDANFMIPDAQVWQFGILTSSVHMAWTKAICGRLTSRIRYSAKIVYNNFVWMKMEFLDYMRLTMSAKKILKARANYPNASLADLYDDVTMPKDLREAHNLNDKIVMKIYGYNDKMSDEEIAIDLLEQYQFVSDYIEKHGKPTAEEDGEYD